MKYLLLLITSIFAIQLQAQHTLSGVVSDSASSKPVDLVEIILKSTDNEWSNISDEAGRFRFEGLAPGTYQLTVNYNFEKVFNESFELKGDMVKDLRLSLKTLQLNEVTISQKVFQKKSDRFIFDVSLSPKAKGNSAFGLLQETPLLSSIDGKSIRILGKSNSIIFVNGRKTNMDAEAITEYLKNIPSEQIQRIEVITTPGSEYQAEANEGIINIVLKKQQSDGYNGTIRLTDNQGYYNNPGAGLNYNMRKGKLAFNTGVNASSYKEREKHILSNGNSEFRNETVGVITDPNHNFGASLNAEYALSKKQTIGMTYNFRYNKSYGSFLDVRNYINGIFTNRTTNLEDAQTLNHSTSLNYEIITDSLGSKISANISYLNFERVSSNTNTSFPEDGSPESIFRQKIPQYIDNMGANLDYVKKTRGKSTWLFGGSFNKTSTDNDTRQDMLTENGFENNAALSNHFIYNENIIGLYATYELLLNKQISGKVGSRFELTKAEGMILGKNNDFTRDYKNILPYINLSYGINDDNNISYSFSSRVRRPTFWELNPTRKYFTPNNYLQNNPFMLASKNYNQELNYMFKNAYYAIVKFQYIIDATGQLPMQGIITETATNTQTRFLRYIRTNYGNNKEMSLSLGLNKTWFDGIWSTNYMTTLEYNTFKGTVTEDPTYVPQEGYTEELFPYVVDNDNTSIFFQINNNIRLTSKKDLFLGLNYWYVSAQQVEFGRLSPIQSLDINIRKTWRTWTLMLEVQDLLRTNKATIAGTQEDGFYNNIANDEYNRSFNVRLTYNFGNQKLKKAREVDAINSTMKGRL